MGRLITTSGVNRGTEHKLSGTSIVGRHEESEVVLADRRASRKHARIEEEGGKFYIEDLGSRNGTLVNGKPVTRVMLHDGDEIAICESRFVYREETLAPSVPEGAKPASSLPSSFRRSMVTFLPDNEAEQPHLNAVMDADATAEEAVTAAIGKGESEAVQRAKRSLRMIWKVANALVTIHDLQELLEEVMNQLFEIFPQVDRGFVLLKEEGTDDLQARVIRSRDTDAGEAVEIKISSTVVNEIMTKRKAVLSSDALSDDRFSDRMSIVNFQICSMMAAPLIVRGDILGLIHIDTTSNTQTFTEQDLELLTSIAPQVAVAIRNAQLIKEVELETEKRTGLQRYISPDLVDLIMANKLDLAAGRRRGTAFFSDIIGFTRMSEKLEPSEVVARLNRYFHVMEEIIFRHGGTIDKFGGDSIMAFWGVLVERKGAVLEAVTAAVEMQNALFMFNLAIGGELARDPLYMGIGLNTGEFIAGDIGSEQKVEFTVIGDSVNLAQRIESKAGRGQVFISYDTFREVKRSVAAVELPEVGVKGRSGPVKMYSVRAVAPPSAGEGILANLPVRVIVGDKVADGLVVWAKPERKRLLAEICASAVPEEGTSVELGPCVQEKPGLANFTANVLAARAVDGPGSALVEIVSPTKELTSILSPGMVVRADITAEEVVRR